MIKLSDPRYQVYARIAQGIDRNVLVYDFDAVSGEFTSRLVALMSVVARRHKPEEDRLVAIWVGDHLDIDNALIAGVKIKCICMDNVGAFYKSLSGAMGPGDTHLVIGITEKSTLLGSY
jgi:hypothetical protein